MLPMIFEVIRCYEENIVDTVAEADMEPEVMVLSPLVYLASAL
jgi:hypothetical protein